MNGFENTLSIATAHELIAALGVAPQDRMLVYSHDLSEDEWDENGFSTRNDSSVLLVGEGGDVPEGRVVGVVGSERERDRCGRRTPDDIRALMDQAERRFAPLAWVYDGAFALPQHPRAEAPLC